MANFSEEKNEQEVMLQEPTQDELLNSIQETVQEIISAPVSDEEIQEPDEEAVAEAVQETFEDLPQDTVVAKDVEDIQFEEVFDLEAIQQKLQDRVYEDDPDIESSQDVDSSISIENETPAVEAVKKEKPSASGNSSAKKYVIYIEEENIDFMESLSVDKRKDLINEILKEQNGIRIKQKELEKRKTYVKHLILACFTFIIGFPIMLFTVNRALEASINNYQQSRENFSKLYKNQGKVRMNNPEASIKY